MFTLLINYLILNFKLQARPPLPHQGSVSQPPAESDSEKHEMDTDQPLAPEDPLALDDLMQ